MPTEIDILTDDDRWAELGFDTEALTRKAVLAAIRQADIPAPITAAHDIELSVLLTHDDAVQVMNRDFRSKDKPTNVLSFATIDDPECERIAAQPGPFYLGDLALALETLQREAVEQEKSLQDHFTHLVVHGTLHLLGYDHMEDDEAEIMEALEIKVLSGLGVENPYLNPLFVPD